VLACAIWTEVRGHDQVTIGPRALSFAAMRQALSVALLGIAAVIAGTFALLVLTDHSFQAVLFESISAFATVGLTTGITGDLGAVPQLILIALMFLGRVGTITVATALALHTAGRLFRLPEERPIIG